jgi:hypothetical protein
VWVGVPLDVKLEVHWISKNIITVGCLHPRARRPASSLTSAFNMPAFISITSPLPSSKSLTAIATACYAAPAHIAALVASPPLLHRSRDELHPAIDTVSNK